MGTKKDGGVIQTVQNTRETVINKYGDNISRSLHITGASGAASIIVGFGKLAMGILSLSFFTCVSAFYTFGMVIAKYCALAGIARAKSVKEQYRYYTLSGIILIAASVMYIAYSIRLFFYPANPVYDMNVAIAIATFTFTELTLNIRGVIITRRNHDPLIHAIKMINLASSLICLVLTQTAILSFASTAVDQHPAANGLIGIIMGSIATLLGIFMIIRIKRIKRQELQGGKHG